MDGLANESPQTLEEWPQTQPYSEYSLHILPYTGYLYRGTAISEITKKRLDTRNGLEYKDPHQLLAGSQSFCYPLCYPAEVIGYQAKKKKP